LVYDRRSWALAWTCALSFVPLVFLMWALALGRNGRKQAPDVGPPYLLDILMYIKKISSRAIIIKITHTTDPTIKRDISAKGLAP
jgi:hypothetical protein